MARLLNLLVSLLRGLLGLCALGLMLAALYVSLGRELAPLVAEYRDEVQDRARQALGMPLRIGSLEGRWQRFAPLLIAHDVQLGEGASALRLDQVRLVPDVLASLRARQPRLAVLELEGLQLSLSEDDDGRWRLEGLPSRADAAPLDPARLIEGLRQIGLLSVLDSQIVLEPRDAEPISLSYLGVSLQGGASGQRLDGRLVLPDGQPLSWSLQGKVNTQDWRDSQARLYLSLPQSDWARWLPARLTGDWRFQRLLGGGEFWLDWAAGSVQRAAVRLHAPELAGAHGERKAAKVQELALSAYFRRDAVGFELLLDSLALNLGETRWGETRIALDYQAPTAKTDELWQVRADRIELGPLVPLIEALAPLPEAAAKALDALQPRGAVANLRLDYHPQLVGPERLEFAANLEQIGFGAYHGAPAAENVSGSIAGDFGQGELRLASDDFALHLDQLFPAPWRYRQANARLTWRLDDEAFTLISPYLQVVGEEGRIAGDFLIRITLGPDTEDYMDLRVGLRDGDARFTEKYLPTRAPGLAPELADWLKTAIRGGAVEEGYFQYQGSLNKGAADEARSLSLFFKVADAELAFQPGWPALREARGEVFIEDSGVRVRVSEGRLLESRVRDVSADIPRAAPGQPPRMALEGELASSLGDALRILQEAPLGTAETFAGWRGEGPLAGRLKLGIPLRKGQQAQVQVDFATEGAHLRLPQPALELTELAGAFRFDSASGLSAPDIRARAFGREVRGKAIAEGAPGRIRTRIEAKGAVAWQDLSAWLALQQPLPLSGVLPYDLQLVLDGNDSQLRVQTDLKGLAVELPAPFGKPADEVRDFQWRMTLAGAERRYWLDYDQLASLSLAAPPGQLGEARGELRLGPGAASLPTAKGLRVRGSLQEVDWASWQAAFKPYLSDATKGSSQLLRSAELQIGHFRGFGTELEALTAHLERGEAGWNLALASERLKGRILLADAANAPIGIDLDYLRLPASEPLAAGEERVDPLADVDPRKIPALDVRIAQVAQGGSPLGAWSLKARPVADGVRFSELDLGLKGLQVTGDGGWEGARSWFKGRLQGQNLADVLLAWNFAPSASSERFHLDADGHWPGSPAAVGVKRFTGRLDASLRNGQFVEVEGGAQALRVFGLLNFNSIGRRLRLDFSDLLGKGLSYDRVKGELEGIDGVYVTRKPITLTGPSSNLELDGTLDLANDQVDAKLLVTLPVTNNLPLAALIVGAPAIGGALFVVDKLLGDRVARFASVQYKVQGSWQDPKITFDKPFEKPQ